MFAECSWRNPSRTFRRSGLKCVPAPGVEQREGGEEAEGVAAGLRNHRDRGEVEIGNDIRSLHEEGAALDVVIGIVVDQLKDVRAGTSRIQIYRGDVPTCDGE